MPAAHVFLPYRRSARSSELPQPRAETPPPAMPSGDPMLRGMTGLPPHGAAPVRFVTDGPLPHAVDGGAATGEDDPLLRMGPMLHALGFQWFAYGTVALAQGRWRPSSFFTGHANPRWTERYFSQQYQEVDPRVEAAQRSAGPWVWDRDGLARQWPPEDTRFALHERFLEDLRASGIGSGVLFRLPAPPLSLPLGEHTLVSLQSERTDSAWIGAGIVALARMLAEDFHRRVQSCGLASAPAASPLGDIGHASRMLSAMQLRILEELRQGRGDKEIAHRLQMSGHAVDYHLRQLRARFKVRNRVQLVNAAARAMPPGAPAA
ncbi:autoinducer binding domain-containing protein [Variovorax paradoxus]|uniref:helix-turn-helix transcriptional regulator n=1 Tax=Variovorax paradoxus TaxID=34073 RepID=UPI0019317241|nr:autoinducer binding domain-containing protein [Variovorax paradoxus]